MALARSNSGSNSVTFDDAKMLLYFKAIVPQYQADIEKVNEGYMGSIEHRNLRATGDGTWTQDADVRLTREYNLPTDMLDRLDHVYARLDGINWIPLIDYDRTDIKMPFKEDNIKARYSNDEGSAGYTIFRKALFLLCGEILEEVTDGLEIWTYTFPPLFTAIPEVDSINDKEMDTYGIPEQLHKILAMDLSIQWKNDRVTPIPLNKDEQLRDVQYKERMKNLKGLNRSKIMSFERPKDGYDNGFNL